MQTFDALIFFFLRRRKERKKIKENMKIEKKINKILLKRITTENIRPTCRTGKKDMNNEIKQLNNIINK